MKKNHIMNLGLVLLSTVSFAINASTKEGKERSITAIGSGGGGNNSTNTYKLVTAIGSGGGGSTNTYKLVTAIGSGGSGNL